MSVVLIIRSRGIEVFRGHPNDDRARGRLYTELIAHGHVEAELQNGLAADPPPLEPPCELDDWRERSGEPVPWRPKHGGRS